MEISTFRGGVDYPSFFVYNYLKCILIMERDKLKLIVKNLKLLVEALESEVYSDIDAYQTKQENFDDPANYYITDYDEVFNDDDGYPD